MSPSDQKHQFFAADDRVLSVEAGEWGSPEVSGQGATPSDEPIYIVVVGWDSADFDATDLQQLLVAYDKAIAEDYRYELSLGVYENDGPGDRPEGVNSTARFDMQRRGEALGLTSPRYLGDWSEVLVFDRERLSEWVEGWE